MRLNNEKGITLLMLVITVIVMLILAGILISVSLGDISALKNGRDTKFREKIETLKSKVDEKVVLREEITGKKGAELSEEEINNLLEGYSDKFVIKDNQLKYKESAKFSNDEKKILEDLNVAPSN